MIRGIRELSGAVRVVALLLLVLQSGTVAWSDEPLRLEAALEEARRDNPGAAQAEAEADAARSRVGYAGALPDPRFKAGLMLVPVETKVGPQWLNLSLSQGIPFPGKLGLMEEGAAARARAARLGADARIRDLLTEVKLAYINTTLLQRSTELLRAHHMLALEALAAVNSTSAPLFTLSRARAEAARLEYDLEVQEDRLRDAWQGLASLLGRKEPGPVPRLELLEPFDEKLEEDSLIRQALADNLDLRRSGEELASAGAMRDLAGKAFWPDFEVGATWLVHEAESDMPDAGKDAFGVTLGLSIPLWRGAYHDREEEARAMVRAEEARRDGLGDRTRARVRSLLRELREASRLYRLYSGVLGPQAMAALDSAEDQGVMDPGRILETRALVLKYELGREKALAEMHRNLALLEQVVSGPVEVARLDNEPRAPEVSAPAESGRDPAPSGPGEIDPSRLARLSDPGNLPATGAMKKARRQVKRQGVAKSLAGPLTWELVLAAVLEGNAELRARRQDLSAAASRYTQVGSLGDLLVAYSDISRSIDPGSGPQGREDQGEDGPGRLRHRLAVVDTLVAAVALGLEQRKAVTTASRAYADYWFQTARQEKLRELAGQVRDLLESARSRVRVGLIRQEEILAMEMMEAELGSQAEDAGDLAANAAAVIRGLAGLSGTGKPGLPTTLPEPGKPGPASRRVRDRQEIKLAALLQERLGLQRDLQRLQQVPGLALPEQGGLLPGDRTGPSGTMDDPLAGSREAWLVELTHKTEAASLRIDEAEAQAMTARETASRRLKVAVRTLRLHQEVLLPKAEKTRDLMNRGYSAGTAAFKDLVFAQQECIRHELEILQARRDGFQAWTDLQDADPF